MPKIFMKRTDHGAERVIPVEEHSVPAREASGWSRVTPAQAAKIEKKAASAAGEEN